MSKPIASSDLNVIFNCLNSGIVLLDQKLNIIYWNDWMVKYSEISAATVINQPFETLFPELTKQRIFQAILNNLKKGLPSTLSNI